MEGRRHHYAVAVEWTGNRGTGTSGYRDYDRTHVLRCAGKPDIPGSSDPAFRGDTDRWNPEELLVAGLSACHKLTYLHLAAVNGIVVTAYEDRPTGVMVEDAHGGGRFERVRLRPKITISAGDPALAASLNHEAHERCFLAASMNFPVECEPEIVAG
jgi:organic hydroperoxide reductase OsmC/OhrA